MEYKKINNLLGWVCFTIATITYILTLEGSVSFWDCGEFISCAYRLQVAHQPGYPLFAMIGKAFSLLSFGDVSKIPYFTNVGSAVASGLTVMFLFWTITALARKILANRGETPDDNKQIMIMGAGLVGALAFAYTDTFWFSAVETIVFAWSALCTAVVFWAILKWDAHADEPGADRWLIFIAYMIGLSIGIHLLNLLTIPAVAFVYYFRRSKNINNRTGFIAFLISIAILGTVQFGIRQFTIKLAAYFDLFFVNDLGFGFGSGAFVFFILLVALLIFGIRYSIKHQKNTLKLALLCAVFIYFGYSSFVYIPIRASANTDLDNTHPDNAFTLNSYLNRDQYGATPLITGPFFDAKITGETEGGNIYRKGEKRYEVATKKENYEYDHTTFFPRMWSQEGDDPQFYRQWMQMGQNDSPTFGTNISWFLSWQTYQMYFRYFFWNFIGRVNDMDGQQQMGGFHGYVDGDWTSGILDGGKHLPKTVTDSASYTPLYALPFVIGLIGMFFHFKRNKRDAFIVGLLWFFTGLAIILYVNQEHVQPRERDYSYVGSFYAFAIWLGLGVVAIADFLSKKLTARTAAFVATGVCLLAAPVVLAKQEWRSHDRSTKRTPHDMAYDYLISCPKNAILFSYGDNDTYSLWYDQEVENLRPDVRIVNLSLFSGDWYIRQMQRKMNDSEPLPITMPFSKYKEGVRDVVIFDDRKIPGYTDIKDVFDFITSDNKNAMVELQNGEFTNFLTTKALKISVNGDNALKAGIISADQKAKLADSVRFKYPKNLITKDNLALLDILAHNDWKRPICFTITAGSENLIGLQPYLYKLGYVYSLMPLKPDTSVRDQMSKANTAVMYDNVMNKFKFGQFSTAKYLDHESTTMFYPVMISTFYDLGQALIRDGKNDQALKVLHRYDSELPDLNIDIRTADSQFLMLEMGYKLHDLAFTQKWADRIDYYLTDMLNYDYYQMQSNGASLNPNDIGFSIQLLSAMANLAKDNHQNALYTRLQARAKDYESKFAGLLNAAAQPSNQAGDSINGSVAAPQK